MAILTALTGENIVCGPIWDGTGAADPAHGGAGMQIWSPTTAALSPNRFVAVGLYTDAGGTNWARYMLIDQTGSVLQSTNLPYLGASQFGLITLDQTHLLETRGIWSSGEPGDPTPYLTVRRISVSDTAGFTVDYTQTTMLPDEVYDPTFNNDAQIYVQSQGFVVQATKCEHTTERIKLHAVDATNGNVLWTYYEPVVSTFGQWNAPLGLAVSGDDKVTLTWPQNMTETWTVDHYVYSGQVVTREYTVTGTAPTPTGPATPFDSSGNTFEAAMWADPYQSGKPGYLRFHTHSESDYDMEFEGVLGDVQQCTTGQTTSLGVQQWPLGRPIQQGLPFVAFGYQSYCPPKADLDRLEGVRTICWDPATGEIELSETYNPTLFGVTPTADTYATWRQYDEVNGGGICMSFDPASGTGIMAVTFVMQQTYATSQYLQMSVWILQGPSQKPNLSGAFDAVTVRFSKARS